MVKIGGNAEETVEDVKAESAKPAKKARFKSNPKQEKEEKIPHKKTNDKTLKAKKKEAQRAQKEKEESRRVHTPDMAKKENSNRAIIILGASMLVTSVVFFFYQFVIDPIFTPSNTFVFQATEEIAHGEWIEPDSLAAIEVPSDGVLPSMVVNTEDLNGYASRNILVGEPILLGDVTAVAADDDLDEYLFTSVELAGTPVLQDGAMVNVYIRSGSTVSLLFDEPKRVYSNSTIGNYTSEDGTGIVESANLLLTDDEFEAYHEAIANQEVIVAARLHPDRRPGLVQERPEPTDQEITQGSGTDGIIESDLDLSTLSDEEVEQLMLQYINTELSFEELQTIDGVDEDTARAVMAAIGNENGFSSLMDLLDIDGVDESVAGSILDHIIVQIETGGGA